MNVRHSVVVLHSFSIKNIFYDKMDFRLFFLFSCDEITMNRHNTEYFRNALLRNFERFQRNRYFRFTNFRKENSWIFAKFFLRLLSATDKYKWVIKALKNNYESFSSVFIFAFEQIDTTEQIQKRQAVYKWPNKKFNAPTLFA